MNPSKVQAVIEKQSKNCVAELEQEKSDFENSVSDFLTSIQKNCLLVETKDSKLGATRIMQVLKQAKKVEGNEKAFVGRYLGAENQTFLQWQQLLDIAGQAEELPTFSNLLLCMFPDQESTKMKNIEHELLHKIIDSLKNTEGGLKKISFITSQEGFLDEYLKEIDMTTVVKINEFVTETPSTTWGKTKAFLDKASCGDVNGLKELLHNEVDVNVTSGEYKLTALHVAAIQGHTDVVLTLLRNGADILQDTFGDTALHIAVAKGHKDIVLALIENGGDLNLKSVFGYTALHHANAYQITHKEQTSEQGANILTQGELGEGKTTLYEGNRIEIINILLDYGADINATTLGDDTPLHCAVLHDHFEAVKILLDRGIDVQATNEDGETALDIAMESGNDQIAFILRTRI